MKTFYLIISLFLIAINYITAQNLIVVQNSGTPQFYTDLTKALTNAQSGDTIYIPGGSFDGITIEKRLHVIGVGHHPDSTNLTGRTIIKGITINTGAANGSIEGIYNLGPLIFNTDISGYTITRSYLSGGISDNWNQNPNVSSIVINENIIGAIYGSDGYNPHSILFHNSTNTSINNNIIISAVQISNGILKNNIFLYYNGYAYYPNPLYSTNCVIENNIFTNGNGSSNGNFHNNVNAGVNGTDSYGNQGNNNFLDYLNLNTVFVQYDATIYGSGESIYKADFHLQPTSPYKNAGRDGTEIGIYGGAFPWKAGSIPSNPHFQALKIGSKTDESGNLNIQIKVAAQDH